MTDPALLATNVVFATPPPLPRMGTLAQRLVDARLEQEAARALPDGHIGRDVAAFMADLQLGQIRLLGRELVRRHWRGRAA